jgi:hypothetical protein
MTGSFITVEDLAKVVQGATLIGSGGGGSPSSGAMVIDAISKITDRVQFVDLDEVPDESVVAAVCGFGSPDVLLKKGCVVQNFYAVEALERATGKKIDYIVPYESGGYNSITPFYAAAVKGIPVLDCDGTGRAVCEWYISMFEVHRIPISPFALANERGHAAVVYADNMIDVDRYARGVLREFGLISGTAEHVMSGAKARVSLVPRMISMERDLGAAILEARGAGEDPLDVVLEKTRGFLLLDGTVTSKEVRTSPIGSDHGLVDVEGRGPKGRTRIRVSFKNESILATWPDGSPAAILPDIIAYLGHDGQPLTNADVEKGSKLRVIAIPINKKCRDPRAIPLYRRVLFDVLGFEGPYVPVEELQRTA